MFLIDKKRFLLHFKRKASQNINFKRLLWSHLESNQAPTDYESVALTE